MFKICSTKPYFFVILTSLMAPKLHATREAFVVVPVADLTNTIVKSNFEKHHQLLPLDTAGCCDSANFPMRLHQLLFNEVVKVVDVRNDQACVEISNAFYQTNANKKKNNRYWTLKKNIKFLSKNDRKKVPNPIKFDGTNIEESNKGIVTLTHPFDDPSTGLTFSAGTRFVENKNAHKTGTFSVFAFDPKTDDFIETKIPKQLCLTKIPTSDTAKIDQFVSLLKSWANETNGPVPYVWGGCSLTTPCKYHKTKTEVYSPVLKLITCPHCTSPKNGFDCSGVILRAAQICEIPVFAKNTTTILKTTLKLEKNEKIETGDLIVIPGHVVIVSNLDPAMIIEARGQPHGYGILQEIPLNEEFENMRTYDDLMSAYRRKKPIQRLRRGGAKSELIRNLEIVKMY